ncbi:esterase-like activity of phytase family protein [Arsenicibacter rosenii]|uniref:esterase-like activity of phytase family protein n=1 Tax=Arsenicibacter rosenii TaxID=1750698 RepID=UPI0015A7106F|nr:esterase-like activity of phytase family protein [Arsenicibacter rosenii]
MAQRLNVRLKQYCILEAARLVPEADRLHFGGISAIEYVPGGPWILVNDRAVKPKKDSVTDQTSYLFTATDAGKLASAVFSSVSGISGVENVESYRYNPTLKQYFFAAERDQESLIGVIGEQGKPETLYTESPDEKRTSDNRGIEGLTFDQRNNLWFSLESGGETDCRKATATYLFKVPFDTQTNRYNFSRKERYTYPFDACACLPNESPFTGSLGNGISEILHYDTNTLLVLERCYDGKGNGTSVKLFLATISDATKSLSKSLLFDFNDYLRPDNLEGMTWGPDENGQRTLYVISDDNFSARQTTQLIVLTVDR